MQLRDLTNELLEKIAELRPEWETSLYEKAYIPSKDRHGRLVGAQTLQDMRGESSSLGRQGATTRIGKTVKHRAEQGFTAGMVGGGVTGLVYGANNYPGEVGMTMGCGALGAAAGGATGAIAAGTAGGVEGAAKEALTTKARKLQAATRIGSKSQYNTNKNSTVGKATAKIKNFFKK